MRIFRAPILNLVLSEKNNLIQLGGTVRHVTGNDKDYLRKIPRVVW